MGNTVSGAAYQPDRFSFSDGTIINTAALVADMAIPMGNDLNLAGTDGDDIMAGGLANDILSGYAGQDQLSGGRGSDKIEKWYTFSQPLVALEMTGKYSDIG